MGYIFIHIPKCAGSSMEAVSWNKGGGHATLQTFYKMHAINPNREPINWREYCKWSFVRNPWERAVSTWESVARFKKEGYDTFKKFTNALYKEKTKLKSLDNIKGIPKDQRTSVFNIPHVYPMLPMLKVNGAVDMDFIGRYERLEEDWVKILDRLSTPKNKLNNPLPKHNVRKNKTPYQEYYTEDLVNKMGDIYQEDIEYFGYKFGE